MELKRIATIYTDFKTKFGIPRQAGLVDSLHATIVFEPAFRVPEAVRELEHFSHIWLIWDFSEAHRQEWSPTVRPPRLGGNKRVGVFATRSPFRPNPLGLSSVRLLKVELNTSQGPVLHVCGADLMNKTPIFDIKPYLPFTDAHPDALSGFAETTRVQPPLQVILQPEHALLLGNEKSQCLCDVLAQDPRPHYQHDANRIYAIEFAEFEVKFKVEGAVLTVLQVLQ